MEESPAPGLRWCCRPDAAVQRIEAVDLRRDPIVDELRRLMPEASVAGGSFAPWLPHPRDVASAERTGLLETARREATRSCLTGLLVRVGLRAIEPARLASGAREWPRGYTGSVSHKGTTVVAAIAPTDHMPSIGIDVERLDAGGAPAIPGLNAAEQPWSVSDAEGRVILLSIKEAAYKALHPVLGHPLGFADVAVSWLRRGPVCSRGVASACGVTLDVRCSIAVPTWIVSAALCPTIVTRSRASSRAGCGQTPPHLFDYKTSS